MTPEELTGRARSHILQFSEPRFAAHPLAARAFLQMREAGREAGLDLAVFSGFRDFAAQARIWRLKAGGERPLYDAQGQPLEFARLSPAEVVRAILRWSALPGASRHHWGSELDLIDLNAMPPGYRVELLPAEYGPGGVFERLNRWLGENLGRFGFFRPYASDLGGVAPEPWHASFAEVSVPALEQLSPAMVAQAFEAEALPLAGEVSGQMEALFETYVTNICAP